MNEIKEYKPLEPDYNVQCAVENLKMAYWSNEPEKVAKNFTEAEDIIISAICHHGYTVCKQPQGEWIKQYRKSYELITDEVTFVGEFTKCPKCLYDKARGSNFCPNCGADMRCRYER